MAEASTPRPTHQHRRGFITALLLTLALLLTPVLTACGSQHGSSQPTVSTSVTPSACPTANTKKFAKTRMVTNVALAGGAFHRYIWKAKNEGKYSQQSRLKRYAAYGKGAVATVFIIDQLRRAHNNALANPTFCKFVAPLGNLQDKFTALKDKFKDPRSNPADIVNTVNADAKLLDGFEAANQVKDQFQAIPKA